MGRRSARRRATAEGPASRPGGGRTAEWSACELAEERLQVVIDRSYPMTEIVEAHRHVDAGHKVSNVVIDVSPARDR
ncbi:zinc-binding dehydrogenase [Verrucosispora sioxanthis]|uniref:zinc-binding dehydrogenase n=1 Tax=Verrucosispora sioxanthis TaxID=2499994 RepID=UPI002814D461|nr:zinc-binding dehydrogenase [Verrucosispora sioxanthis]